MPKAQHPKAASFVRQKLFAGVTNFTELEPASPRCRMNSRAVLRLKSLPRPIWRRSENTWSAVTRLRAPKDMRVRLLRVVATADS